MVVPFQSLFLGPPDGKLLGHFHPAAHTGDQPVASSPAMVICPPLGREDISAYASLLHLAEAAAHAGVATLRFDYLGCGNSSGDDEAPDRVTAWTNSVTHAIEAAKELAQTHRVVVLGLRLGALLAYLACEGRTDVAALVALAPVVSGRAYVRELRALQMTGSAPPPREPGAMNTPPPLEAGGFVISDATRDALSGIDLLKRERAPAARMLIVSRDDMPLDAKWPAHLQALGVQLDQQTQPGYAAMMADPHFAEVPRALIAATVDWLRSIPPEASAGPVVARPDAPRASALVASGVIETIAQIETIKKTVPRTALFGIVAERTSDDTPATGAVLMLNAGAVRSIGPNRMAVPLARQWAANGRTVLRIDIAGLGDSPPAPGQPDNVVYSPQALDDLAAAIDWLRRRTGRDKVQVVGLCSGAYHAFRASVAGLPIESAVMINPLTFFWKAGMSLDPADQHQAQDFQVAGEVMRHRQSMWQAETWLKLVRGDVGLRRLAQIVAQRLSWTSQQAAQAIARRLGVKLGDDLAAELQAIARRGIRQHYIFADTDPGLELLRARGGAMVQQLQQQGLLTIDLIEQADHTFTWQAPRERMLAVLTARVERG